MRFVIKKAQNGQFWWQIVSSNGQVMAASETMTRKQSCLDAIASVRQSAGDAEVVDESDEG